MKIIKILLFSLFLFPLLALAQEIDDNILENKYYMKRIAQFKSDPLRQNQVVFLGNSITEAGQWSKYFPSQSIANRGVSGDNTEGMLARVHEVIAAQPSKIFIMVGINDIALGRPNHIILRQLKMLLRQIKARSPQTLIFVQSALPINDQKLKFETLRNKEIMIEIYNAELKAMCNEMELPYIDIYTPLLERPLSLNPKHTNDGLHINKEAYAIWVEIIRNYVEQ